MALDKDRAIVTLQDAKRHLNVASTSTADDRLIDACTLQASMIVSKAVGTNVVWQTYLQEQHEGHGGETLMLNNWPVTDVMRVAVGKDDVIRVTYGGSGALATVRVNDSEIVMRHLVSGAWSDVALPLSDYASVTALAAGVSGVTGWTGAVTGDFGGWPATDLMPSPAQTATGESIDLSVPGECETDYEIMDADSGMLYSAYGWSQWGWERGRMNIIVDYKAGWRRENIPAPLQAACLEAVAELYRYSRRDPTLQSESLGDYSWTAKAANEIGAPLFKRVEALVTPYRRLLLGGIS